MSLSMILFRVFQTQSTEGLQFHWQGSRTPGLSNVDFLCSFQPASHELSLPSRSLIAASTDASLFFFPGHGAARQGGRAEEARSLL